MVANTLKSDLKQHIESVTSAKRRYPALRYLDELVGQEIVDFGREKVRYNKHSGTYGLLWLLRSVLFNVRFVEALADGHRRPSRACADEAYHAVLRPFHGFLLGGIVRCDCYRFILVRCR